MSYRSQLNRELIRRKERNPQYSLRAFARDLELSIAFLSQMLSGKRALSEKAALALAQRLGWGEFQVQEFVLLHRLETASTPEAQAQARASLRALNPFGSSYTLIETDAFAIISRWYHLAIVEWARVADVRHDTPSLARRFDITPIEAELAIERLVALGFLGSDENGYLRPQKPGYTVREIPSEAVRKFHASILDKAAAALQHQPPAERDFSAMTLAIDPALLPEARERIRRFTAELAEFLESHGTQRAVYQLGVQLFRLDENAP